MKKVIIILVFLLAFGMFSGMVCALGDSVMDVKVVGTKEVSPNAFKLTYSVETFNDDAQKAINENNEIAENLYKTLNTMINKNRGDYAKTSNYSLNPQYDYKNGKSILKGYKVYNTLQVYVKDVMSVSKFVNIASIKGVTRVDNLVFESTNYEDKCNDLMAELALKAKKRANATLKPLNMQVLTVKNISTTCSQTSKYPAMNFAKTSRTLSVTSDASEGNMTPIETGRIILNGTLNTTFYIGVKK